MAKPELFLEHEGFGKVWHISLHASGEWHMVTGRKERARWDRPAELFPGYTRAVGIVQPVAVAHREGPAPADVQLVSVAPDADPTTFSLFIERPGANGVLVTTVVGELSDGAIGLIDLRADPSVVATIDSALGSWCRGRRRGCARLGVIPVGSISTPRGVR